MQTCMPDDNDDDDDNDDPNDDDDVMITMTKMSMRERQALAQI